MRNEYSDEPINYDPRDVAIEILRAMYRAADPPADWDKLANSGMIRKKGWCSAFYLDGTQQTRIKRETFDKHRMTSDMFRASRAEISLTVSLYAPGVNQITAQEIRKGLDLSSVLIEG